MKKQEITITDIIKRGVPFLQSKESIQSYKFTFQDLEFCCKVIPTPRIKVQGNAEYQKIITSFRAEVLEEFKFQNLNEKPNILKSFDCMFEHFAGCIIQENFQCNLKTYLKIKKPKYEEKLKLVQQIAQGLKQMKEEYVCHRNIIPENIVFCEINQGELVLKLSDFSVATQLLSFNSDILNPPKKITKYTAPEILERKKHNFNCDLWSLGAIFYEMLFGSVEGIHINFKKQKEERIQIDFPAEVPQWLKQLIIKMLSFDPEQRYPIQDVLRILKSAQACADVTKKAFGQK